MVIAKLSSTNILAITIPVTYCFLRTFVDDHSKVYATWQSKCWGWFWMTEYVPRFGVFYKNGERCGVLSDCEELWSRQIVETLIIEVAIMLKRD